VEYAFTDNLIGRAEYPYADFGDFDFTIGGTPLSGGRWP
jgi:opacity protein-like surface antigen